MLKPHIEKSKCHPRKQSLFLSIVLGNTLSFGVYLLVSPYSMLAVAVILTQEVLGLEAFPCCALNLIT